MSTIKCLLVDDEPPAIALLEKYTGMIEHLEVVGKSHSALKAFALLKDTPVDLMFLDIQMPVLNGIDFINSLTNPPAIILTTAYREYALDGYDLDIIDYLLKPIPFNRFLKAVDRYRQRTVTPTTTTSEVSVAPPTQQHIFFNVNRTKHKVFLKDILYIESLKDYVRIHTTTDKLVVKGNLGSILQQLPGQQFVRVHRSFAVAIDEVQSYNQSQIEIAGITLPIGISFREALMSKLR